MGNTDEVLLVKMPPKASRGDGGQILFFDFSSKYVVP